MSALILTPLSEPRLGRSASEACAALYRAYERCAVEAEELKAAPPTPSEAFQHPGRLCTRREALRIFVLAKRSGLTLGGAPRGGWRHT